MLCLAAVSFLYVHWSVAIVISLLVVRAAREHVRRTYG
jgi:hypothetical protein